MSAFGQRCLLWLCCRESSSKEYWPQLCQDTVTGSLLTLAGNVLPHSSYNSSLFSKAVHVQKANFHLGSCLIRPSLSSVLLQASAMPRVFEASLFKLSVSQCHQNLGRLGCSMCMEPREHRYIPKLYQCNGGIHGLT